MSQHTFITYSAMFGFWLAVFPWLGLCGGQGGPMMAFDDLSGGYSAPFGSLCEVGAPLESGHLAALQGADVPDIGKGSKWPLASWPKAASPDS